MSKENNLESLRRRIDEIDLKLLELINERVRTAGEIGADKASRGEGVYRPEREAQVFSRLIDRNDGPIDDDAVRAIFGEVISCARSAEAPVRVAALGPRGTFSEQAAHKVFGRQITLLEAANIREVFRLTESGDAQFGVVPVENSTEGSMQPSIYLWRRPFRFAMRWNYASPIACWPARTVMLPGKLQATNRRLHNVEIGWRLTTPAYRCCQSPVRLKQPALQRLTRR